MYLKIEGMKNTKRRNMIIDLLNSANTPLSADDIYIKLKNKNISVWVSTIYRTLNMLEEKGIVAKDNILGNGKAFYELNKKEHKHRLVCMNCKKIVPFEECPFKAFGDILSKKTGFEVTGHRFEVYGLCAVCKKL